MYLCVHCPLCLLYREDIAAHVVTKTARGMVKNDTCPKSNCSRDWFSFFAESKDHYSDIYIHGIIGEGMVVHLIEVPKHPEDQSHW